MFAHNIIPHVALPRSKQPVQGRLLRIASGSTMITTEEFESLRALLQDHAGCWNTDRKTRVTETVDALKEFINVVNPNDHDKYTHTLRRDNKVLQLALLLDFLPGKGIQKWPKKYSPCEVCALPTGNWCETCNCVNAVVCTKCEAAMRDCRDCVKHGRVRPAQPIFVDGLLICATSGPLANSDSD